MHPLVFALLITALVCVILSAIPTLRPQRTNLWVAAALLAVLGIALHLFVVPPGAGAAEPPDPYAVPRDNPQPPRARAQALPIGAIVFLNGTNTGPPSCEKLLVPALNAESRVNVCAVTVRPPGGGGLWLVHFYTSDGILATLDARAWGFEDCFGAEPFLSDFSGTIKAILSCKDPASGNGNDRVVFPVDSGLEAYP